MQNALTAALGKGFPWAQQLHCYESVTSTNVLAKELATQGAPHGTILLASHQSAGRGRLGRSFHSPNHSGLYLSLLLRPRCNADALMHLTCSAAVAACDALEAACGCRPGIKWTNDLVWGTKKVGGILTELGWTGDGKLDYAIIGIGVNRTQQPADFPQELQNMAASVSMMTDRSVDAVTLAAEMIRAFYRMDQSLLSGKGEIMARYRADCITLGKDICLLAPDGVQYGHALDVDDQGALTVRFADGTVRAVAAGEVSVRGMYGYI